MLLNAFIMSTFQVTVTGVPVINSLSYMCTYVYVGLKYVSLLT